MSIRSWLIKREIRKVEEGKYGPEAKSMSDWIKSHKGPIGIGVTFAVGGLYAAGYKDAAEMLFSVATLLLGAGYVKSDQYHKDRLD